MTSSSETGNGSSAVAAQNLILLNSLATEDHSGFKNRIHTISQLNDLLSIVNAANTASTTDNGSSISPATVVLADGSSTSLATDSDLVESRQQEIDASKKSRNRVAAVPGKPRGATYDGNLCMICSDKASGFHYGVLACEGCKGFFKRVCKEKNSGGTLLNSPQDESSLADSNNHRRQCVFGGRCEINVRTRNRCQHCRMQKCIDLGMSKGGIKLGRRSKKFKQNLPVNSSTSQQNGSSSDDNTSRNESNGPIANGNTERNESDSQQITSTEVQPISSMIVPHQQPQIIAILQDNRLILKAIDMGTVSTVTPTQQLISIQPNLLDNQIQLVSATPLALPAAPNFVVSSFDNNLNNHHSTGTIILTPHQDVNSFNQQVSTNQDTQNYVHSSDVNHSTNNDTSIVQLNESHSSGVTLLDKNQLRNIKEAVWQAYQDTKSSTSCLINNCVNENSQVRTFQHIDSSNFLTSLFDKGLLGLLNESGLLEHLNTLVEGAVLFAKNVPYFMNIHEADRINLLKSSVFEIICVQHSKLFQFSDSTCMSSSSSSSLATLAACALGNDGSRDDDTSEKLLVPVFNVWTTRQWLSDKLPQMGRFLKLLFEFYCFLSRMKLSDTELAYFCSYLLLNAEDQGLNDIEKIKNYRNLFLEILVNELERSRRNIVCDSSADIMQHQVTMTSVDKKDIEIWINTCCIKLKQLNYEHAKILIENKSFVQFPDLYAELYNL